ncbi:SAM-dependent methyltransferase [Azospirillum agricola]|uniref:class I SAM-dependent methyltransferase n=1 Tax=Azospirillum agricola TaxID=1720247 RepID=UPI001AEB235E|nr:class I SAM-dependent methyltransferase [Azospirillum agricola]MBP2231502.1 SAM-dependent methyltransferase [Azospirillum agricola]
MDSARTASPTAPPSTADRWVEFWNRPHSIYANRRHLEAHFARIGQDVAEHLPSDGTVLDFGCGDALAADAMAERCGSLLLFDASPAVRARLTGRFSGNPRVRVLDERGLAALPPGSVDLLLVVSVLQYIPEADLPTLLERWRKLLSPGGRALIADVVDPGTPMLADVASQLRMGWEHGFLTASLVALLRLTLSDYRQVRREAGFATYTPDEVLERLEKAGLRGIRLPRNIGPTPHRRSFIAHPRTRTPQDAEEPAPALNVQ